tara:strand:- start:552 stop:881 length:330 start_codon:yes stop_codon:yes gene_type:complete
MKYLSLATIKRYEKLANAYNVSRVCRGLDKSTKTNEGFLVVYKKIKDSEKLKHVLATKNTTWDSYRRNVIKAKLAQMQKNKIPLYIDGIPSKMHTILIMWAYSPDRNLK